MESEKILKFIKLLTAQKNKDALIKAFIKAFESDFPGSCVTVFEHCRIRINGDHKNTLVAINTQDFEESVKVDKAEKSLFQCVSKREVVVTEKTNIATRIYPILSLKKVLYTLKIKIPILTEISEDHIEKIIAIFNDLILLLHSKDHDALTGLMNRVAYNETMNLIEVEPQKHISYASDQKPFTAIGLLDIDFFKRVNDKFGHLIGDEVLLIFSQIIKTVFRHSDLLFRYGGEEFVVILKDVNPKQAESVFERCRLEIEKQEFPKVERITASIGFAIINESISPHVIVDRADKALYYAKENGRNQIRCYDTLVLDGKIELIDPQELLIGLPNL